MRRIPYSKRSPTATRTVCGTPRALIVMTVRRGVASCVCVLVDWVYRGLACMCATGTYACLH